MVNFNEVRICDKHRKLVVDCSIDSAGIYAGMYIDSIYLDYYENVDSSGLPSPKAVKITPEFTNHVRSQRITITDEFLSTTDWGISTFRGGLFYVIVQCDGTMPSDASVLPCGYDDTVAITAVPDWEEFYNVGMQHISSLFGKCQNNCEIPAGFEQFALQWEALKLAIAVCDWSLVRDIWRRIIKAKSVSPSSASACGCGK